MLAKVLPWVTTVLLNIVAPIVVYDVAAAHGIADVPALLLSGIPPLVEMVATVALRRHADEFSVFVLILIALSVLVYSLGGDAQLLLLRESAVTGLFGLVLLLSIPTRRPLIFLFGRRFATDGTREGVAWWNDLWERYPLFRRTQRAMTLMWGATLLAEAVVRGVLTYRLPVATMVVVNSVVPPVVIACLVIATFAWGRRAGKAGEARRAAAEAAEREAGDRGAAQPS